MIFINGGEIFRLRNNPDTGKFRGPHVPAKLHHRPHKLPANATLAPRAKPVSPSRPPCEGLMRRLRLRKAISTPGSREEVAFQVFPWIWVQLMQCVFDGLVNVPREPVHEAEHRALVAEAIDHHASCFLIKSILALHDPTFVLYPPWLSVLARALLWMGGWRPTAALRLVPTGILSAEQAWAFEAIREVTRAEVALVEEEMRRVQIEGVVGLTMAGRAAEAEVAAAEKAAIERMLARQWTLAVVADSLRMKVLRRVVAVLSPLQAVDFLAAVVRMEISMHQM
ncbi:hypothetical protein BHM03_00008550 [Ensete ventricosum]|nr:hypothetical protein BHM03_00008550 [Ensete ventricosum]